MDYQISEETRAIIVEALADVTPRQAALAMLRFGDYLRGLKGVGVPLTPEFVLALYDELKALVLADCRTPVPSTPD